jgi:hypothetical protein
MTAQYWLYSLYEKVQSAGGIVHCLSVNCFEEVIQRFRKESKIEGGNLKTYLLLYVTYVLRYEVAQHGV